ncbi:MAG: tyrosine-type recombinase/integrase [Syntrophomonas sp.]
MAETRGRKPKKEIRGHGEGCIYQRKDGTYAGISRYVDPETGKKKKHFVYGKSRKEAAAKKKAWEDELKKGLLPKAGKMTVEDWLDIWLDTYAKIRTRQNTFEGYKRIIDNHLKPTLGKRILNELRPEHVQKMINERLERGNKRTKGELGARQVEYIYAVLHMAMERAVKNGLVIRNVCDVVDKPRVIRHEFMPWTVEETNKFLTSTKDSRLFPLYLTAWGTGLRRAELLGLRWDDIDLKRGTLTVRRVLVRIKGGHKFQEPKTKKSRRTVPLPHAVTEELKSWKARLAQEELKWRGKHKELKPEDIPQFNPNKQVFPDELGQPMNPEFVSRSFKRDLGKAKLPEIRFHDLRHGHATMLLELGEDLKVISERLGHSTITMTADIYGHVRERLQREASHKLDKVLNLKEIIKK